MRSGNTSQSIAFRCDGNRETGAGHVGRCLPLADGFRRRGWRPTFFGHFGGIARDLIDASGHRRIPPTPDVACGVDANSQAAILDCYEVQSAEIAQLAQVRPVATLGESPTCAGVAVHVDFHVDRLGADETPHLLPGPTFAPVDPRYRRAAESTGSVRTVLLTLGAGSAGEGVLPTIRAHVASQFPDARILEPSTSTDRPGAATEPLHTIIGGVDVAVCGAGFTAYELATAGTPCLLIALVDNQQRVLHGMTTYGLALAADARREDLEWQLRHGLASLASPMVRSVLARRSLAVFDGRGAERVVEALIYRWFGAS